ncbi:3'(2'),5'-bisphosphate nucleotidase CysQ [Pantoea sp. Mhis]|uniref:3'(2'),5'-bisphosphate nucleotidase CysQ n=1 Tax=Pantoea sp. Mhis TaxID=2576759 RepID=UPI001358BDD8|nr:3'(2'),5'-bisphosphate nucleotidase CysQ [Pantoea sp. Mhis]MXP56387.1 3'(2'),5'-bisphosphate nucleotidase CysQ [Pantoea sp. Mhis]
MLDNICQLVYEAGTVVRNIYDSADSININRKLDQSPVTSADIAAHNIIIKGLKILSPEIPVISEEELPMWKIRQYWHKYWLIDPLDGTKEFIKHNGEFTINIALIEYGKPTLGVIYAPILNTIYAANSGKAWKEKDGHKIKICVKKSYPPLITLSRSHSNKNSKELKEFLYKIGEHQIINVGSSLKFCLIAEGKAQIYPRFGSTNIWDTAAGHAVAVAAGAYVHDWSGKELDYFPRKSFLNLGFIVSI